MDVNRLWARAEHLRHGLRLDPPAAVEARGLAARFEWQDYKVYETQDLLDRVQQLCASEFRKLDEFLTRRGHFRERVEIAYRRIIAPLLEHEDSGGVERGWTELSEAELVQFVKAGITRERILLDREADVQRVQDAADHSSFVLDGPEACS